jgi:hypothetical protein
MLDNSFGDSLIDKIALVAKLKSCAAISNATAMTRLVSGSNLELSKNCVMGMTCPTIGNALIMQIPACDFSGRHA